MLFKELWKMALNVYVCCLNLKLNYKQQCSYINVMKCFRHYMQGNALEERVHKAVTCIFEEMRKVTEPFDPAKYINFIVGNIVVGMCYGKS